MKTEGPSTRAQIVTRRTYNRPLDDEGRSFETWEDTVARVIHHQRWLWERALKRELNSQETSELEDLRQLMLERKVSVAGRTLWLGGTEVAKKREASQFNCGHTEIETVYDAVDHFWLLLQGCGVGFTPIPGTLNGFRCPIPEVEIVRSERTEKGGNESNTETFDGHTWWLRLGDSAEAWAKSLGKLLAGKYPAQKLVLDFSQVRPEGERLKGYGWICSGDRAIARAYEAIAEIMNRRAGDLLTAIDIMDIMNWAGTVLSSRRSAEIALMDYDNPEAEDFAVAKKDYWIDNPQRGQSNNSLVFHRKPSKNELRDLFRKMLDAGGSEPGFINGVAAKERAPWMAGFNPCAEIILPNKGFCNLVEIDVSKFSGDMAGMLEAARIAGRANYRQTCVNLQDGILQEAWHLNNEFLRLCGVGITGEALRPDLRRHDARRLSREATVATYEMADELGTPRPKNVTTIKPSGTMSKIMDTTEGCHKPMGRFVFNNVNFSRNDPLVEVLRQANYRVQPNPVDPEGVLVTFPVDYSGVRFHEADGMEVNLDSAVSQLEHYKQLMRNYVQHNASITVSYDPSEVEEIVEWLDKNWDDYVGVAWILRNDPTKRAEDLGHPYLPQEVVTQEEYEAYVSQLGHVDIEAYNSMEELRDDDCSTGACPVK